MLARPPARSVNSGASNIGGQSFRLTWMLALLSALTFEVAASNGERSPLITVTLIGAQAAAVWLLNRLICRFDNSRDATTSTQALAILALATIAFGIEVAVRSIRNTPLPVELLVLSGFRDVVLVLAAFAHRIEFQRMSCSLSTFLMIFASSLAGHVLLHGLVVLFAVAGIWWLMASYWATLRGRLAATSAQNLSMRWWIMLPIGVLAVLALVPLASSQTHALQGFMPTSGGSQWYSESARSGVGDGDALVAGTENIRSFAPIEDAPFLNSHEPSLYDLFDDTYDEPAKPSSADRAIALLPQFAAQQKNHELAQSLKAGREFSTLRKSGGKKFDPIRDRDSHAVMYVKGRVPLHLKLEVFDRYDGIDWFPEELPETVPELSLEKLHGRPWLRAAILPDLELYGLPEVHVLKIIRLDTNRVPSPNQFLRLHLDQLDRSDLFAWAQPGILQIDRQKIPSLTVMHIQSRVVDDRLISKEVLVPGIGPENFRQFGEDEQSQRVRKLANEWTKDLPYGWPQVKEIVSRLKNGYSHDRSARPNVDCRHTVADFLFERRAGPDYQFASAAVWLLRSQGYGARLASGFYVDPSRYESRSQHTPVLKEDLHFWPEVNAGYRHWIPLEPTPGYELLKPVPTFVEHVRNAFVSLALLAYQNVALILIAVAVLTWLVWQRRRVADALASAWWSFRPAASERMFVRQTLALLEGRFRRAGFRRPPGSAPTRWLTRIARDANLPEREVLQKFARLADWACYSPSDSDTIYPFPSQICREAVDVWSWKSIVSLPHAYPASNGRRILMVQASRTHLQSAPPGSIKT